MFVFLTTDCCQKERKGQEEKDKKPGSITNIAHSCMVEVYRWRNAVLSVEQWNFNVIIEQAKCSY